MKASVQPQQDSALPSAAQSRLLQRKCACGGNTGLSGECDDCRKKRLLQPKLTIGQPGDRYEREADRVAEQIMRMPAGSPGSLGIHPVGEIEPLQKKAFAERPVSAGRVAEAAPAVDDVLRSPGHPLDAGIREAMEPRFGHGFGSVRVHADGRAARAASAVSARAFTVGSDLVFGAGNYRPETAAGKRLIAHELTHVVQQRGTSAAGHLQRAPEDESPMAEVPLEKLAEPEKEKVPKKNVAFYMDKDFLPAARLLAAGGKVIFVDSPEMMKEKLEAIDFQIRDLAVLSHSTNEAKIKFGKSGWVEPGSLAGILRGSLRAEFAPALIDFRGCSLGMSPSGMEQLRGAIGAASAIGSTCFIVTDATKPVTLTEEDAKGKVIARKVITRRSQVTKRLRPAFEKFLELTIDGVGPNRKQCILDTSEDAYFRAKGQLVIMYANPMFSKAYVDGVSTCYKDLSETKVDPATVAADPGAKVGRCKLVRVDKSKVPGERGGGIPGGVPALPGGVPGGIPGGLPAPGSEPSESEP